MSNSPQAVVFLTHIVSARIYRHFLRLKAETENILDAFLCVHEPARRLDDGTFPADFWITSQDEKYSLPRRFAEKNRRGGATLPGFADLAYMPALVSLRLSSYAYIWLVEYDVDYAGSWRDFFAANPSSVADLLGTDIASRLQHPGWEHWHWLQVPAPFSKHVRSFLPIGRFSRRMLNAYLEADRHGGWRGHFEALFPTIANCNGLKIEDLGSCGPFTPDALRGRNYGPETITWRPVRHTAYFTDAPERFPTRGLLYHPVKVH